MSYANSSQGSDLAIPPPEAGEQVGINEVAIEEVPANRGLRGMHEAIDLEEEGEEIGEAHPPTPSRITNPSSKLVTFCLHLQLQ